MAAPAYYIVCTDELGDDCKARPGRGRRTDRKHEKEDSMSVFRGKILLATDGSPEAERAAGMAAMLSEKLGLELHVKAEEEAGKFLTERAGWIEAHGGKVEDTHVASGRPDAEIVRLAEELRVGLTVVGSTGLGGVGRALMGSVSDSVVRHAHSPVLVARSEEGSESAKAQ